MRAAVTAAAANVWTLPSSPRSYDAPMLENPPQIRKWLASMGYEERLQLCTDNLVQTQALFGEEVIILKEEGEWAFVAVPGQPSNKDVRGYPGWMKKASFQKTAFMHLPRRMDYQTDSFFISHKRQTGLGSKFPNASSGIRT